MEALDLVKYQSQAISKLKDLCATGRLRIGRSLDARVDRLLPEQWRAALERINAGFDAIQDNGPTRSCRRRSRN
ncbi:hypothetical protein [Burkholderia ubonensis]|uniref:hypothetical protein n=1 Tax=Burkholderia ubonensis TaxID=101571 RepID=UPI000AEF6D3A|nr:hypothetical protein [Burkholderia ubonensis]